MRFLSALEGRSILTASLLYVAIAQSLFAQEVFSFQRYATVRPAAGWSFAAGEFTGDNHADLAAYHPSDGSVWVGRTRDQENPLDVSFLKKRCTKRGADGQCNQAECIRERDPSSPSGFEAATCAQFSVACEAHGHSQTGDGRNYSTCTRKVSQ